MPESGQIDSGDWKYTIQLALVAVPGQVVLLGTSLQPGK